MLAMYDHIHKLIIPTQIHLTRTKIRWDREYCKEFIKLHYQFREGNRNKFEKGQWKRDLGANLVWDSSARDLNFQKINKK